MACGYSTVTQRATHYLRSNKSLRRTLFLNAAFACGRNVPKIVRCHPQGRSPYQLINTEKSEATIVMRLSLGSCKASVFPTRKLAKANLSAPLHFESVQGRSEHFELIRPGPFHGCDRVKISKLLRAKKRKLTVKQLQRQYS